MQKKVGPMKSILLLEDDANLGFILKEHLEMNGYAVQLCANGVEGMTAYRQRPYALLLVDVMMPKKDGFTFVQEVRVGDQQTPIIFLTAKSLKEDRIRGFKVGCDDYVTKPFSMEELMLRVQVVLKRSANGEDLPTSNKIVRFQIGSFDFDYERQMLMAKKKEQKLTGKEADLLRLLCLSMNRTLEREVALKSIWGDDSYFNARSMDVFISKLRRYLSSDATVEIVNVHGKGFKLVVS
jgi:two-component system, OmpR family, response regulator VicR